MTTTTMTTMTNTQTQWSYSWALVVCNRMMDCGLLRKWRMKTICNKTKLKMNVTHTNFFLFVRFRYRSRTHTAHTHYRFLTSLHTCVTSRLLFNLMIFWMHVLNTFTRQKWPLLCSLFHSVSFYLHTEKWLFLLSLRNQSKLRIYNEIHFQAKHT